MQDDLRSRVAKALGRRSVPDDVWQVVQADTADVDDAELDDADGGDLSFQRLVTIGRLTLGVRQGRGRAAKPPAADRAVEDARSGALGAYLAAEMAQEPSVRAFREHLLGGRVLTGPQARAMLLSPAARMFSSNQFQDHGLSPARHKARVVDERMEGGIPLAEGAPAGSYEADVMVEPAGEVWTFRCPDLTLAISASDRTGGLPTGQKTLALPASGSVDYWRGSVISELARLGAFLERRYRLPDCAVFVLTGRAPPLPAIHGRAEPAQIGFHGYKNTITLTVRPYVAAERVAEVYRELQRGYGVRPRRPLSERNLRLVRFVSDEINRRGGRPTFRALMELWNAHHPDETYRENRLFWRDYDSARRVLEAERFGLFGWGLIRERKRKEADDGKPKRKR